MNQAPMPPPPPPPTASKAETRMIEAAKDVVREMHADGRDSIGTSLIFRKEKAVYILHIDKLPDETIESIGNFFTEQPDPAGERQESK